MSTPTAERICIAGEVSELPVRERVRSQARRLGLLGWVKLTEAGSLCAHVEGEAAAIEKLVSALRSMAEVESVSERSERVEGHEQFAIRGVPAGSFVVREYQATARGFDLRLEVEGRIRSWAVPKGPSMDPSVKRFAVEVEDDSPGRTDLEGHSGESDAIVWDRGAYEQGGRVPWPEALNRGHAVFVLHGEKLRGGFALQRTRGGKRPQWLMIKRRDEYARPGSDIVAERPNSVDGGLTLDALLSARQRRG